MGEGDVERFSTWGPEYDESRLQSLLFWPVQSAVLDVVAWLQPEPSRMLDVGCGTGALLRQASGRFPECELFGVDPAPGMVKAAQEAGGSSRRLRFAVAFAQDLPFPDAFFDVVVSTISFHHWGEQAAGLRDVGRVLRPGGFLVLADILAVSLLRPFFFLGHMRNRFHTPAEIEGLLTAAGFDRFSRTLVRRLGLSPLVWAVSAQPRRPR